MSEISLDKNNTLQRHT